MPCPRQQNALGSARRGLWGPLCGSWLKRLGAADGGGWVEAGWRARGRGCAVQGVRAEKLTAACQQRAHRVVLSYARTHAVRWHRGAGERCGRPRLMRGVHKRPAGGPASAGQRWRRGLRALPLSNDAGGGAVRCGLVAVPNDRRACSAFASHRIPLCGHHVVHAAPHQRRAAWLRRFAAVRRNARRRSAATAAAACWAFCSVQRSRRLPSQP